MLSTTSNLTTHEVPPAREFAGGGASVTEFAPARAVKVPPQVFEALGTAATVKPEGSVSVKLSPFRAIDEGFAFVTVIVTVETPPVKTGVRLNVFVAVGGCAGTMPRSSIVGTGVSCVVTKVASFTE